jgi:hypothetical protein
MHMYRTEPHSWVPPRITRITNAEPQLTLGPVPGVARVQTVPRLQYYWIRSHLALDGVSQEEQYFMGLAYENILASGPNAGQPIRSFFSLLLCVADSMCSVLPHYSPVKSTAFFHTPGPLFVIDIFFRCSWRDLPDVLALATVSSIFSWLLRSTIHHSM